MKCVIYGRHPVTGHRQAIKVVSSFSEAEAELDYAENHGWTQLQLIIR